MKYLINYKAREIVYMNEEPTFSDWIVAHFSWTCNEDMVFSGYDIAVSNN